MPQITKIVKLLNSYIPGDPNTIAENLRYTVNEDSPEQGDPIVAFEGYNFLPTEYGYRSYFGESALSLAALTSRCSELLMFQGASYANLLIALCEDGIWTSDPSVAAGAWVHEYTVAFDPLVYKRWTYTILNGNFYCYQEGNSVVNILNATALTWTTPAPSFLTMAGQKGIFRAGGRLGFWDSANSVSWTSALDYMDATPSLVTGAGNTKFRDVVGNIVTILPHGDGFIIYSTKSIVGVHLTQAINSLWKAAVVNGIAGIAYSTHVCQGASDTQHFVYATNGLAMVGSYSETDGNHQYAPILTGTSDFLRESNQPMRLTCHEGRYLFLSLIDDTYIDGAISSRIVSIPGSSLELIGWDRVAALPATLTSNQATSLFLSMTSPVSYSTGYGDFYGGGWDGTYRAEIDYNNPSSVGVLVTVADATQHWGALAEYAPLKVKASRLSFLNSSELSVEGAINTFDNDLSEFRTAQAAYIAELVALPAVVTTETFPGVGVYPDIPADPADEIVELGLLISGAGRDKLIQTDAGTLLNSMIIRRYFNAASRIDERREIHYTEWLEEEQIIKTYATWTGGATGAALSNGDLTVTITPVGLSAGRLVRSSIGKDSGKWYWEYTIDTIGRAMSGIDSGSNPLGDTGVGYYIDSWGMQHTDTDFTPDGMTGKWHDATETEPYGTASIDGDVIGIALDMDTGVLTYYKNGSSMGVMFTGITGIAEAVAGGMQRLFDADQPTTVITANFGASAFVYSPPVGYNIGLYDESIYPYTLQGTVSTTKEATPITGEYGYSQLFVEATEFNKYQKDKAGNWNLIDTVIAGGAVPPVFDNSYPVGLTTSITYGASELDSFLPDLSGYSFGTIPISGDNPAVLYEQASINISYPPVSYNMIDGTPAPLYPTYSGALVVDIPLEKWGKFKGDHQLILDYTPQNTSINGSVPYTNFGSLSGALHADGSISLFNATPTDSWIRYGKAGYYRLGYTQLHEVKAHFRVPSTGVLRIESSIDGRNIEDSFIEDTVFTAQAAVNSYNEINARWHTITISGQWDLQYLEIRGNITSRR